MADVLVSCDAGEEDWKQRAFTSKIGEGAPPDTVMHVSLFQTNSCNSFIFFLFIFLKQNPTQNIIFHKFPVIHNNIQYKLNAEPKLQALQPAPLIPPEDTITKCRVPTILLPCFTP